MITSGSCPHPHLPHHGVSPRRLAEANDYAEALGDQPIWPLDGRFFCSHGKVGIGVLKSNKKVFSEGLIVRDTARRLDFAVVWQNVIQDGQPQRTLLEPVAALIEATISAFVP
jgi:hypothetical protein